MGSGQIRSRPHIATLQLSQSSLIFQASDILMICPQIYIYIYMYIYTYIYIHIHTYIHIHIYIHIYPYSHTYIHTYVHTDRQTDIQTDIHTYCTYIHTHIYIYTVYTYAYIQSYALIPPSTCFLGDTSLFASHFDVHQGIKVLTHNHKY